MTHYQLKLTLAKLNQDFIKAEKALAQYYTLAKKQKDLQKEIEFLKSLKINYNGNSNTLEKITKP